MRVAESLASKRDELRTSNRPLLTFAVLTFDQEQFIEAAVEGALAQTYSPLEIILSDDCSTDSTFRIMQRLATRYHGPHKIVLNCNDSNLGLVGHVNRVVALASGRLIVVAAGDDISLPERTALSYDAWERSGRKATSIYGRLNVIDGIGQPYGGQYQYDYPAAETLHSRVKASAIDYIRALEPQVLGCCHTFDRRLFEELGPLPAYVSYEDAALELRSFLLGEIAFINQPLVTYRRHGENTFGPLEAGAVTNAALLHAYHEQVARECARYVRLYDCFAADVRTLAKAGKLKPEVASGLQTEIAQARRPYEVKLGLFDKNFSRRLRSFWHVARSGGEVKYALGRLFPQSLYDAIFLTRAKFRRRRVGS